MAARRVAIPRLLWMAFGLLAISAACVTIPGFFTADLPPSLQYFDELDSATKGRFLYAAIASYVALGAWLFTRPKFDIRTPLTRAARRRRLRDAVRRRRLSRPDAAEQKARDDKRKEKSVRKRLGPRWMHPSNFARGRFRYLAD